ncbi:MAG: HU family DNA-binding protein [Deltaproteobacteria bacterium]
MTKKEIVKRIAERAGLTQLKTKQIVQWTFNAIIDTLMEEKRIELRNFGVFEVKRRKARKARNPRTDEQVFVAPKNVVTFQPGKEMEDRIRKMPLLEEKPRKMRKMRGAENEIAEPVGADPTPNPPETDGQGAGSPPVGQVGAPMTNGHDHGDAAKKKKVKKEA